MSIQKILELNTSHLAQVSKLHRLAFPESALTALGDSGVYRYYAWQISGPHRTLNIGFFDDDVLVGFCFSGIFNGALSGFLRKNILFLLLQVITHPGFFISPFFRSRIWIAVHTIFRKRLSSTTIVSIQEQSFGILSVAVLPEARGKLIGKKMMEFVETEAKKLGYCKMHLTVNPKNNQAITFYERLGWGRSVASDGSWYGAMTKSI